MRRIVLVGSHLGYPMDRTPLGGGAMVGLQLARHWAPNARIRLTVLGSGPLPPAAGVDYVRLPAQGADSPSSLVDLSELEYAAFCRQFEAAATRWLLDNGGDPRSTCLVVNDVSEAPALAPLAQAGYPILSLWHVDVVDYFNKLYLRGLLAPETVTRLYEALLRVGASRLVPDMLKLIFEKQRETVMLSRRMVFPSRAMAETVRRCYRGRPCSDEDIARRSQVVPWGHWEEPVPEEEVAEKTRALRAHYQLGPDTRVLMTLSRISPEKGIHLLLEALALLEERGAVADRDTVLFVCGEAAFMQGAAYQRRVREAAARLRQVRVFFPGYLAPADKKAYLEVANLFVSPSIHESYGLNVVEAMRAGLPILSGDHYGVRDWLDDACGRRVAYPSRREAPAALAEALSELLAVPERLAAMGAAARRAAAAMPFHKAALAVLSAALELLPPAREEALVP